MTPRYPAPPHSVRISRDGVFYTLQGEGPLAGTPAVFLRLDSCNLRCQWGDILCDASYTSWSPGRLRLARDIVRDQVMGALQQHNATHCVITGGEPLLQQDFVAYLCAHLHQHGIHVTIETNGTVDYCGPEQTLLCISPKLHTSTPAAIRYRKLHTKNRWNPGILQNLRRRFPHYWKFVIHTPEDVEEVLLMLQEVGQGLPAPRRVYFMPQGVDGTYWERGRWIADECKRLGVSFSPRLQIDLWGNTPGT